MICTVARSSVRLSIGRILWSDRIVINPFILYYIVNLNIFSHSALFKNDDATVFVYSILSK